MLPCANLYNDVFHEFDHNISVCHNGTQKSEVNYDCSFTEDADKE